MVADKPTLLSQRWMLQEFVFLEYLRNSHVAIEVGPFSENPTDEQADQAFDRLAACSFAWLTLAEEAWALDFGKLAAFDIPGLALEPEAQGVRAHLPGFEWASFLDASGKRTLLRITFPITPEEASTESISVPDEGAEQVVHKPEVTTGNVLDLSCPKCKAINQGDSTFCDQCGELLHPDPSVDVKPSTPVKPEEPTPPLFGERPGEWGSKDVWLWVILVIIGALVKTLLFH